MNNINWQELSEIAPATVEQCVQYFQDRYMGRWQFKMNQPERLLEFLRTKSVGVQISGFNWHWSCKVWLNEALIYHHHDGATEEDTFNTAIHQAFLALEDRFATI